MERLSHEGRLIEILHFGHYDVILNGTAENQAAVNEVAGMVEANLSSGQDPYATWAVRRVATEKQILVNHPYLPKYATKKQWWVKIGTNELRYLLKLRRKGDRLSNEELETKKCLTAVNSISAEMAHTQDLRKILNCEEAVSLANKYGYEKIIYVEPLLGVINRKTGDKYMTYTYINGVGGVNTYGQVEPENEICGELFYLFAQKGWMANDLADKQFIESKTETGKVLNLLDTEGYVRKTYI